MPIYSYEIGASYVGMTNLESLTTPLPAPKSTFRPYSQYIRLGDGTVRGSGWAEATWRWGFLTRAQRNQLRTFCTGASANVYIKTRKNDSSDAYQVYMAIMIWPEEEEKSLGKRIGLEIRFTNLVEYSP